jgi:hypothetical protein
VALEPSPKRAIVFFDGQNLYHAARKAFGYTFPNFDPVALVTAISHDSFGPAGRPFGASHPQEKLDERLVLIAGAVDDISAPIQA